MHHRGATAEGQCFDGLARRVDDDGVALAKDAIELAAQFLAQLVVEVGERLVEEQDPSLASEGPGDGDALLLAAGQLLGTPVEERRQTEQLGDLPNPGLHRRRRPLLAATERGGDVVEHRHRRVVDELLIDEGDVAVTDRSSGDVLAVDDDLPGGRRLESGGDAHQRRLAGQRRSGEDVQATLEGEVDAGEPGLTVDDLLDCSQFERHPRAPQRPDRCPVR